MCGITGFYSYSNFEIVKEHFAKKMISVMTRRGPDDEGQWDDGGHCWLGFRRLAILDLSSFGHQPMLTADNRYAIVINGEIYNFRELRSDLEVRGVRFRSSGDTEVALYALAEWGVGALERFNGMFALAFYDTREKSLLLARDHAGIKPLYYMKTTQGAVFGSQYNQLLVHPWRTDLQINKDALGLYLRLGYIPAPYALLENTFMLEPGCWVEFNQDKHTEHGRFFEFPVYQEPDIFEGDAYEAVDEVVSRAVKRQLISDVPVGSFLSGGVDSPLVTAKVQHVLGDSFKAFTVGVDDIRFNEVQNAVEYARALGVEQIIESVNTNDVLGLLDNVVSACSEPFADYSIFPTLQITHLARREMTVMLSGDGGDELFWGYTGRMGDFIRHSEIFKLPFFFRKLKWWLLRRPGEWNTRHFKTPGDWYKARHVRNFEEWLLPIFPALSSWPREYGLYEYSGNTPNHTAQWVRWNEFNGHLGAVLLKVDRASMFNSLEVRVPLLDREVIDIALRVDWRSCINLETGLGKIPLRQSLARHSVTPTSQKHGFAVPMDNWLRGPLRQTFEDMVLKRKELLGLEVNLKMMKNYFDLHLSDNHDWSWGLWIFLSLALWEAKHFQNNNV